MLEKMEVYPYQRIGGRPISRRKRWQEWSRRLQRGLPKWRSVAPAIGVLKSELQAAFTLENILMAGATVIMARAFILTELLPFVFAFLAVFGRKSWSRVILLGFAACLGLYSVLSGPELLINIFTVAVLLGVARKVNIPGNHLWWGVPVLTTSVIFLAKTLVAFGSGITLYREMVIVFEAMISGILSFIAVVGEEAIAQRKSLADFSFEDRAAFLVLGIGIILGLNDFSIAGLSPGGILCRLGILMAAYLWGSGAGTMVGVMSGIIPSVASRVFAQSMGMYALSGLLAGMFRSFGQVGSIVGFMLGNLAFSVFLTEGQAALIGIWETGVAALIFFILPNSWKEQIAGQSLGPIGIASRAIPLAATQLEGLTRNRMEELAHIFEEMSSTLSLTEKPRSKEQGSYLAYLYEQLSEGFCRNCPRYERCWEREAYQTSRELLDLFTLAESEGEIRLDKINHTLQRRCLKARELAVEVNRLFDTLRINEYWADRFHQSRELVSIQLKGVSQVIKNLIDEMGARAVQNQDVRRAVIAEMRRVGANVHDVSALEQDDRQLLLTMVTDSCHDGSYCETYITPALSNLLGEKLEIVEKKCPRSRKGSCQMAFCRSFIFKVASGAAQIGKESVCGDSFTIATLKQGKQLIALSDGMGVGEKAWGESQAAVRLLENLLGSGFNQETTLKTINSLLLLRSSAESFATLDMAMIDLYTAEVDYIKIGSAPSFIKRGRKVSTVFSSTPPIGILEDIDLVRERHQLQPGDLLVLVSDGVIENTRKGRSENWFPGYLAALDERDPQQVAECLIQKAYNLCRGKPLDDMTVICAAIELNGGT